MVLLDPVSGKVRVLVPARLLVPPGGEKPLGIADFSWSKRGDRILIFTNTMALQHQGRLLGPGLEDDEETAETRQGSASFLPHVRQVLHRREKSRLRLQERPLRGGRGDGGDHQADKGRFGGSLQRDLRYPKVGTVNPSCRVGIISSSGGETRWISFEGSERDHYIPRMEWAGPRG